ncbi:MAG: glycosyl hydrolase, partial [Spirochaetales bacterium]|nr:glycosyl hydrolase [Candidatus Physcosoma equi]
MIDYKANPLYLTAEDIRWVEDTYDSMTLEERIGQLFCPIGYSSDPNYLRYAILSKHPGGILFRTGGKEEMAAT